MDNNGDFLFPSPSGCLLTETVAILCENLRVLLDYLLALHFCMQVSTRMPTSIMYIPSPTIKNIWLWICLSICVSPWLNYIQFSSVQFSRSVVSSSLQPNELQHARPSCPSPTPGVLPNPCPLCR